jgi:hypothetical protein
MKGKAVRATIRQRASLGSDEVAAASVLALAMASDTRRPLVGYDGQE